MNITTDDKYATASDNKNMCARWSSPRYRTLLI